jgi:hypothetical protein
MLLDHSPASDHAREARIGLDLAMRLFKHGSKYGSGRAKRALVCLFNISCVSYIDMIIRPCSPLVERECLVLSLHL